MKPFIRYTVLSTACVLACALAACGGGGSSGGGGGGGGGGTGGGGTTYTIGGTISGLTASGLVLEDNGGNALTVQPSSGTFQFSTGIANGSSYAVSVSSNPTSETCTVASNGSGKVDGANVTNVAVSCSFNSGSNVVPITVVNAINGISNLSFNDLITSVKVCVANTNTCATIDNILVDTGSAGLRLFASQLPNALSCPGGSGGTGLCAALNPGNSNQTLAECFEFADGYAWGWVSKADVQLGGETATSIPVQVIDDSVSSSSYCNSSGGSAQSASLLGAYGILGVGQFIEDCGTACVNADSANIYFGCSGGDTGSCSSITLDLADQVANPVASFATDNNGIIVQLPAISSTGAATASGSLVFGIGTESNNGFGAAKVLTTVSSGVNAGTFTTNFNDATLNGFIDSGSNALFFPDSSIMACADASQFYCPGSASSLSATSLTATNQGGNGTMNDASFEVANLDYLAANDGSNYALNDVGGPAAGLQGFTNSTFFDWGIPFFYGRTIYVGIEDKSAGGNTGPYVAY